MEKLKKEIDGRNRMIRAFTFSRGLRASVHREEGAVRGSWMHSNKSKDVGAFCSWSARSSSPRYERSSMSVGRRDRQGRWMGS